MFEGAQRSFLGSSRLFNAPVLAQFLDERRGERIPEVGARLMSLRDWVTSLEHRRQGAKEGSLEQAFNQRVLVEVLGYTQYPSPTATAWPKAPAQVTGIHGEPDVILGDFPLAGEPRILAVLELKPPGTPFDVPQSRAGRKTPVEQAFDYGEEVLGVRWVLVSDMRRIRLYSIESRDDYESLDLADCIGATDQDVTEEFRKLFFLLHHDSLIEGGPQSATSRLLSKSWERHLKISKSFYSAYYQIRSDLVRAMGDATSESHPGLTKEQIVEATQRLLDRMLFLYYCEDHPNRLIPPNTVRDVTEGARRLPGTSEHRVYDNLKALFEEVDQGSPRTSGLQISPYNGELFKKHLIDEIDLPDSLHDKPYAVQEPGGRVRTRTVEGVWGLHKFDFWQELNEHLLGHIFEESLSDIADLLGGKEPDLAEKLQERRRWGIYYTHQILSDFLLGSAVRALMAESDTLVSADPKEEEANLVARLERLTNLRIVDFACGSGAFLVSAYRELLAECQRIRGAMDEMRHSRASPQLDFGSYEERVNQSTLLRQSLYGSDLLPQAVEIAKLALWLRSANKGERVADLQENVVAHDSLDVEGVFATMRRSAGTLDLVIGNPPWGGDIDPEVYVAACETLGLPPTPVWDSWELFLALAIHALCEGGRLAMVLPDTFFSPEKHRARRLLLDYTDIEKLHNLGPEWFGPHVRMGTIVIQARKGRKLVSSDIVSVLLTGPLRKKAIRGEVPLRQIEATVARQIPQERCAASPAAEIAIFRSRLDDEILARMETTSLTLSSLCERARGEEMSKAGLLWMCRSCLRATTPGRKKKGGGYEAKLCPSCGLTLNSNNTTRTQLVVTDDWRNHSGTVPYIDGDDIAHRYVGLAPRKCLRLDVADWPYKDANIYTRPKVLIRQAGVGLWVAYDDTGARCPQSVYLYRVRDEWLQQGYRHEFLLGCLLSRTMAYCVFKRFGEVDPARAHTKLTHTRLARLPIPRIDFGNASDKASHDQIVDGVGRLLEGTAGKGGVEDLMIESSLRRLWRLSAEDGLLINEELMRLPNSQALRELFPPSLHQQDMPPPGPRGMDWGTGSSHSEVLTRRGRGSGADG